eukprot:152515_1
MSLHTHKKRKAPFIAGNVKFDEGLSLLRNTMDTYGMLMSVRGFMEQIHLGFGKSNLILEHYANEELNITLKELKQNYMKIERKRNPKKPSKVNAVQEMKISHAQSHHVPQQSSYKPQSIPCSNLPASHGQYSSRSDHVPHQSSYNPQPTKHGLSSSHVSASYGSPSSYQVLEWRKKNNIAVMGNNAPYPIHSFEEARFPPCIVDKLKRAGFKHPTAIQSQVWPILTTGRNALVLSITDPGKTLAFLLPCFEHIATERPLLPGDGPIVLVIAAKRETCIQIENEVFKYHGEMRYCGVYSDVASQEQILTLRNGAEIVICTPKCLLECVTRGTTNLRRVTYLVIDEIDTLLEIGLERQLSNIVTQVRPFLQTLMWSTSMTKKVMQFSKKYFFQKDVIQVSHVRIKPDDAIFALHCQQKVQHMI